MGFFKGFLKYEIAGEFVTAKYWFLRYFSFILNTCLSLVHLKLKSSKGKKQVCVCF